MTPLATSVSLLICVFTMSLLMLTACCSIKTSFSSSELFVLVALDFQLENITIIYYICYNIIMHK